MREIQLTQGRVALVDDADYDLVNKRKWAAHWKGAWYADASVYTPSRSHISMHRLILNAQPGQFVDHKDGNGLNNQRDNLRLCSRSQNGGNRKRNRINAAGFKGVRSYQHKDGHVTWLAQIKFQGKHTTIGPFATPEAAARAYDARARELFGEFAKTNF